MSHDSTTETPLLTETSNLDAKALDRFSRQNAALGAETTAKLTKMKVLIYGMKGLGIETAKNLVLQSGGGCWKSSSWCCSPKATGIEPNCNSWGQT